jgi:hypothetical protein
MFHGDRHNSALATDPRSAGNPGNPTGRFEPRYEPQEPISGPSFLGLSDAVPTADSNLDYLYDDDPRPSYWRVWAAALIAVAFLGFVGYQWKQGWNWSTSAVGRRISQQTASRTGTQNNKTNNPGPAAPNQGSAGAASAPSGPAGSPNQSPPAPQGQADKAATNQNGEGPAQPTISIDQPNAATAAGAAVNAAKTENPDARTTAGQTPEKPPSPPPPHEAASSAAGKPSADELKNQTKAGKQPPGSPEASAAGPLSEEANNTEEDNSAEADAPADTPAPKAPAGEARTKSSARANAPRYSERQPDQELVNKADAYIYGRGVPKSCDQALVYLHTAANHGNASARSKLGGLYATGHCVALDRAEAYNWFTLAREAGAKNVWIDRNREMLWSQMTPDEKARARQ